jgi:hypothetical protein
VSLAGEEIGEALGEEGFAADVPDCSVGGEDAEPWSEHMHPGDQLLDSPHDRFEGANIAPWIVGEEKELRAAALGVSLARTDRDSIAASDR